MITWWRTACAHLPVYLSPRNASPPPLLYIFTAWRVGWDGELFSVPLEALGPCWLPKSSGLQAYRSVTMICWCTAPANITGQNNDRVGSRLNVTQVSVEYYRVCWSIDQWSMISDRYFVSISRWTHLVTSSVDGKHGPTTCSSLLIIISVWQRWFSMERFEVYRQRKTWRYDSGLQNYEEHWLSWF